MKAIAHDTLFQNAWDRSLKAERMQLFECQNCGQPLCEKCGHILGYLPELSVLSALAPASGSDWRPLAEPERLSRFCGNAAHGACNWLLPAGSDACAPPTRSTGRSPISALPNTPVLGIAEHPGVAEVARAFR
jgi:hypothetical protein